MSDEIVTGEDEFRQVVETDGIEIYQTQVRFADVLRHLRRLDELLRRYAPDSLGGDAYSTSADAARTTELLEFNADFDGPTTGDEEFASIADGDDQ